MQATKALIALKSNVNQFHADYIASVLWEAKDT
jgi:hypothetical protein